MNIKVVTHNQLSRICVGSIIKRFPRDGAPEETFDEGRHAAIDVFKIKTINAGYNVIELVVTGPSVAMFASPGDIRRLFIKPSDILLQSKWWISAPL